MQEKDFLPVSREDMRKRGWDELDFVYVSGDAYVDHPSFGHAIITRLLERYGYKVGIIAQPDWKDDASIQVFGMPRLGFLVSAGNMDSMVNHYTVSKKRRRMDAYTPGGVMGKRPDYATVVYCNLIRKVYKKVPIIIGGIEASLRRLAHYDYWSDSLKHSILVDSQADILSYGMGERSILAVAEALESGIAVEDITYVPGTVYKTKDLSLFSYEGCLSEGLPKQIGDAEVLPSYAKMRKDKLLYADSFYTQYTNTDSVTAKVLIEPYDDHLYVVQNPPSAPLTTQEMDDIYALPYMRNYHPDYEKDGGIPAIAEVKFSLVSNRGCFGGCNFCALTFHQGRVVQVRSHDSILAEAKLLTKEKDFKGYIHDVGGPTANFRRPACDKQKKAGVCQNRQCLFPKPCPNLVADHSDYVELLRKLRSLPGVKKVFIRSGIRFDYLLADADDTFFKELCEYHISGQLKVAPEHVADEVLSMMGKPGNAVYEKFVQKYKRWNERKAKKQYLVPYLMSSHPGSTLKAAVKLAEYLKTWNYMPEQVQDFYPTPSTISTCMYYTGVDPRTGRKVYTPTDFHEKAMQRALIQYRKPENADLVREALKKAGREDLIGYGKGCLVRPKSREEAAKDGKRIGKKGSVQAKRAHREVQKGRSKGRKQGNVKQGRGRARSVENKKKGKRAT